ncbi:hypothetical protein QVD17_15208 [Tagetes erecta]|uniref:Uncharacterized protein n=1 Tax=Tagetes erecta TaxID=13708 RepID=A0AAD8KPI5_TARER|nr:hypothetical protein QVD17_15208 [Tagetes erecta]
MDSTRFIREEEVKLLVESIKLDSLRFKDLGEPSRRHPTETQFGHFLFDNLGKRYIARITDIQAHRNCTMSYALSARKGCIHRGITLTLELRFHLSQLFLQACWNDKQFFSWKDEQHIIRESLLIVEKPNKVLET